MPRAEHQIGHSKNEPVDHRQSSIIDRASGRVSIHLDLAPVHYLAHGTPDSMFDTL